MAGRTALAPRPKRNSCAVAPGIRRADRPNEWAVTTAVLLWYSHRSRYVIREGAKRFPWIELHVNTLSAVKHYHLPEFQKVHWTFRKLRSGEPPIAL